ncbi:hypothetical protein MTO96_006709 [Rhipicephalus appendiculatus]
MMDYHVLSHCQKGFLPYDGVFELNYIFQHRFGAARTGGSDLCAALLDFTNAYGSVPHKALLDALRGSGAGDVFTALIADLYRDNKTVTVAAEGTTEPVSIAAGLRQGCPLSGLLFNLVVDPVIRGVQGDGDAHKILAYADDLTSLADSPAQLQERMNLVEALATPLGLALNPVKCSSLHMCGATPIGMRPTTFTVSGVPIQPLQDHQPQRFLGRPVGFRLPSRTGSAIEDAISQARAIFSLMLAPWQRLDAVKTFAYAVLNFAMKCGVLTKTDWRRLDDAVRPLVKRALLCIYPATPPPITSTGAPRPELPPSRWRRNGSQCPRQQSLLQTSTPRQQERRRSRCVYACIAHGDSTRTARPFRSGGTQARRWAGSGKRACRAGRLDRESEDDGQKTPATRAAVVSAGSSSRIWRTVTDARAHARSALAADTALMDALKRIEKKKKKRV